LLQRESFANPILSLVSYLAVKELCGECVLNMYGNKANGDFSVIVASENNLWYDAPRKKSASISQRF
jgi:hypothetical protein